MGQLTMLHGTRQIPVAWGDGHRFSFTVSLEPGLYTVALHTDLAGFDWEQLYYPMTKFLTNHGQRTGPWDFDLYDANKPLLPTWKLHRDGRYVGLFYLQRPTAEDLRTRRLRGEFGFQVVTSGEVTFEAEPYRPFTLEPLVMYLEPNAFDHLETQPWADRGLAANWAHHVAHDVGWDALRDRLAGTEWETFLRQACRAYRTHAKPRDKHADWPVIAPDSIACLVFAYRLLGDRDALADCLRIVDHWLAQPAWGNPDPMGYGHNGDMGCALVIKYLSLALTWLRDELGDRWQPLRDRLVLQMARFVEQQQLMAQYWGGALLQDHGYRSSPSLGFAAINMLGHAPEAAGWLAYYVPRFFRTLDKLPTDGFIPFSSYHKIQLYVNDLTDFRIAWLHASGRDLFAESEALRRVPEYILSSLDAPSMQTMGCTTRGDRKDFNCSLHFFLCLAGTFRCERSRYLARLLLDSYRAVDFDIFPGHPVWKTYETMPLSFLQYAPGAESPARPRTPALHHFADGGAIQYRHEPSRFSVAVSCFSNTGSFHAVGTDLSGTDQGLYNPSVGNFAVAVGAEGLIQCAESGYRTGTELANVLLIDGRGQYGDCHYPMGVPMNVWRGQRIQRCVSHDPDGLTGDARLNLAPAYPDDAELLTYTRDFHFAPGSLRVRDTVVTRRPHHFAYRFHTWDSHLLEPVDTGAWRFAHDHAALRLRVEAPGWRLDRHDTEVVWAYSNENDDHAFQHLEIATDQPLAAFVLDFVIDLES